ncbi:protein kinase [Streptomyces sp. NPDC058664]|uniref:protein kinase domain-containing protein n=1 Tax=unclassified Streptomyces TaxID=2593676 RepID=UPI003666A871
MDHGVIADRYRLGELIGRGAMGAVWAAQDTKLGRAVAIKEIRARADLDTEEWRQRSERALREARAAAVVRHRNVVVVHDVVTDEGRPWIIMELVTGHSLADELATGPMAAGDAARIARQALDGLIAAHACDVVHRDVKPSNLLLSRPDGRTVLTDFGIASMAGAGTLTSPGAMIGTLDYLSPERIQGLRAVPACDLWSLGATLYEMVEGRSPFRRNNEFATLQAILEGTYDPPRNAGPLAEVINGLLAKDPSLRMTAQDARSVLIAAERPDAPSSIGLLPRPKAQADAAGAPDGRRQSLSGTGTTSAERPPTALLRQPAHVPPEHTGPAPAARVASRRWLTRALIGMTVTALAAVGLYAVPPLMAERPSSAAPGPASPTGGRTGFRAISDPSGFTVEIGKDWTGPYADKRRIFYYSADRTYRLGVHLSPPDGKGDPYAELSQQDNNGTGTTAIAEYPKYQRIHLKRTEHNGAPAALWEFTWYDTTSGIRHRSIDLRYTKNGRTYDFWVAGPDSTAPTIRKHFDAARASFSPTR